jgi:hypothetical protein
MVYCIFNINVYLYITITTGTGYLNTNTMKKLLLTSMFLVSVLSCSKDEITPDGFESGGGSTKTQSSKCSSVQCSGTTKTGSRCKNKTTNCNRRCYLHG